MQMLLGYDNIQSEPLLEHQTFRFPLLLYHVNPINSKLLSYQKLKFRNE